MNSEKPFLNFQVDHMTLLLQPEFYKVAYVAFQVIFGLTFKFEPKSEDLIYHMETGEDDGTKKSMTYAIRLGQGSSPNAELNRTVIAIVQPTEPDAQASHVRDMLDGGAAHWQHIALRTSDLFAFYDHARERGVQFVTSIRKDSVEDLIQVFSGELYFPGTKPSGVFFEFVQRNPTEKDLQTVKDRQAMFRDETFMGLYKQKQLEYDSKIVKPFLSFELFNLLLKEFRDINLWEIEESHIEQAEDIMIQYARNAANP